MLVLLELTERFCRTPQKFWQEMNNEAFLVHLFATWESFYYVYPVSWKYYLTVEFYELKLLMGIISYIDCIRKPPLFLDKNYP